MKQIAALLMASILLAGSALAETPPNFSWINYDSHRGDRTTHMKIRSELPPGATPAQYPYLIEMHWKFTPEATGMPSPEVAAQFARLEAAMDPIQGDKIAYLMVVATGNGERSWLWYATDPKSFAAALNNLLPGHPFPVSLHLGANEPDWKTYRALRGNH